MCLPITRAACVCRLHSHWGAQQPPACFSCLHVSVYTARARCIFSALAVFACDVSCAYPSLAQLVSAGCIRIGGLSSLQPASVGCMYQSILLALPIFKPALVACIYPSLAQLVSAGCICIGGLSSLQHVSIACMYQSILLALYIVCTRCFRL